MIILCYKKKTFKKIIFCCWEKDVFRYIIEWHKMQINNKFWVPIIFVNSNDGYSIRNTLAKKDLETTKDTMTLSAVID